MDIPLLYLHTVKPGQVKHIRKFSILIFQSISGVEERLAREKYISDDSEGIIPRATRYLWQIMA